MRISFIGRLFLCGAFFLTGCCSTRFTSTIRKTEVTGVKGKAYFKIVKATPPPHHFMCGSPTGYAVDNKDDVLRSNLAMGSYNISEDEFRKKVFQVAMDRYPELFREAPDAIPIDVTVTGKNSSSTVASITAEILTLTLLGGIFPLPISGTSEFVVRTELHDMGTPGQGAPVPFIRRDVLWLTVFTPLGLIPIPGETACEKTSEVGQLKSFQTGGALTLEGFADAVVAGLNNMDLSKLSTGNLTVSNGRIVPRVIEDPVPEASVPEKLKRLKALKDQGAISEQEYQTQRAELVKKL